MMAIHFSDIHYDEKNHDEIERCMDFMIERIKHQDPDVIICSGDVTNSQYLGADTKSVKTITRQFRELSDIAPVAVVIGTPSHDGMTPELLKNVSGAHPIHVSSTVEQIYLVNDEWKTELSIVEEEGYKPDVDLIVSQVPPPTKEHWKNRQGVETDNQNIAQAMGSIFAGLRAMAERFEAYHILNGHFSMKGSMLSETQMLPGADIAIGKDVLATAGADLVCLGHIHMAQEYDLPGGTKAFHAGSIFRKDFGEQSEDKGYYIHDLDTGENTFVKTPTRRMIQVNYNCVKNPDLIHEQFGVDIVQNVCGEISASDSTRFWVKVVIDIWIDDVRRINQARLKTSLKVAGAENVILEINRVRRENSREETILKAVSLVEKIKALAAHRSQPIPDGIESLLERVETMNSGDLTAYAIDRLKDVTPIEKEKGVA